MTSGRNVVVAVTSLLLIAVGSQRVGVQGSAEIADAPVTHVGLAVRDIDKSARAWAEVLGFPAPDPIKAAPNAPTKATHFYLPNFRIELTQPLQAPSAWRDHMDKYGPGLHHIGFGVDNLAAKLARLEKMGGRLVGGVPHPSSPSAIAYAFVDFRPTLGATFELTQYPPGYQRPQAGGSGVLATAPVVHVGVVVRNAEEVSKAYAQVLGKASTPVSQGKPGSIQFPPSATWNRAAYVKLSNVKQESVGIELLEPVDGPSPWAEYLAKQGGNALHHVSWNVGDKLAETIRFLESKGGKWTNGGVGGSYAYLDFTDGDLGAVIELMGKWVP